MTEQTVLVTPTNGATGFTTVLGGALTPAIARSLATDAGGSADVSGIDKLGNAVVYYVRKSVRKVIVMTAEEIEIQDAQDAIRIAEIEAEMLEWAKQMEIEEKHNAEKYHAMMSQMQNS